MRIERLLLVLAVMASLAFVVAACGDDDEDNGNGAAAAEESSGGGDLSGTIKIDGSSTVAPLSEAAAELFKEENPGVNITVGTSGTGGGFEAFCRGETDISDASRQIEEDEVAACEKAGIEQEELTVANDALSVIVNPENDWAECLTVDQLNKAWGPDSKAKSWKDVDPSFPDEELALFGPGTDSGTFDYFTEAVNGEEGAQRSDYNNIGEDDNAAVTGVSGTKGGMGYLGFSFVQQNVDKIKPAPIENESGDCVEPSLETVQDGSYTPLARELYVYPSAEALQRPEVLAFLQFYIENAEAIAEQAQFIGLTEEQATESTEEIERLAGAR